MDRLNETPLTPKELELSALALRSACFQLSNANGSRPAPPPRPYDGDSEAALSTERFDLLVANGLRDRQFASAQRCTTEIGRAHV